ncbi:hypothetical protein BD414DRAFT_549094 [Trametes punicea]|nr:hypothetical protein BD414DRAFT_549094 [Trametes punicea]
MASTTHSTHEDNAAIAVALRSNSALVIPQSAHKATIQAYMMKVSEGLHEEWVYYGIKSYLIHTFASMLGGDLIAACQPTFKEGKVEGREAKSPVPAQTPDFILARESGTFLNWEAKPPPKRRKSRGGDGPSQRDDPSQRKILKRTADSLLQYCKQAIRIFHKERSLLTLYSVHSCGLLFTMTSFSRTDFAEALSELPESTSDGDELVPSVEYTEVGGDDPGQEDEEEGFTLKSSHPEPYLPQLQEALDERKQSLAIPRIIYAGERMMTEYRSEFSRKLLRSLSRIAYPVGEDARSKLQACWLREVEDNRLTEPNQEYVQIAEILFEERYASLIHDVKEKVDDVTKGNDYERTAEQEDLRQEQASPYRPRIRTAKYSRDPNVTAASSEEHLEAIPGSDTLPGLCRSGRKRRPAKGRLPEIVSQRVPTTDRESST